MNTSTQIQRIKTVETRINKNLFLICGIVTAIVMVMKVTEFFSRGAFAPAKIGLFYLGVLIIYSMHKEIVRWLGERKAERQGECFVYVWIALTTVLYLVNFLADNRFSYSDDGSPLFALREISLLTIEVLAIFIITRTLKLARIILTRRNIFNKISRNE